MNSVQLIAQTFGSFIKSDVFYTNENNHVIISDWSVLLLQFLEEDLHSSKSSELILDILKQVRVCLLKACCNPKL